MWSLLLERGMFPFNSIVTFEILLMYFFLFRFLARAHTQMFPEDGIKIISGTLHSHRAGRKMTLRHVRNGKELPRIIEDDNYDYNYQQVRQLENETVVLPGDYIITDCAYEVSGWKI